MVVLEVPAVVLRVAVEVSDSVDTVVEEKAVLEPPVELKVKLVVDDSVDAGRPSQVSSHFS